MIPENTLNAEELRTMVQEAACSRFSLHFDGYVCQTAMVYDVLLKAAGERVSLEAACGDLAAVADSNTVREALNKQLPVKRLREQEAEMNEALQLKVPAVLREHALEVAIDSHDEPFYGKTPLLREYCCGGQAKAGTTHFYRIASAYVIYRQLRLTLAVTYVLPADETATVVSRLLQQLQRLKLRLRVLYLDKGFCSGEVIRYLQAQRQPALLACPIRGKGKGGTRALCRGRKSYRTRYTFTDGTTVEVVVVATLAPNREKQLRRKWLLFVVLALDWTPKTIYRRYRFRFGIECSYRMLRQMRIKTCSRNPALRFFLLGFVLFLLNLWALVRWVISRRPGPGPYRLDPAHFQLHRFATFLSHAVETIRGVITSIHVAAPFQSVIY
jgi:putative transposase